MITSRACRINAQTDLRACASSKGKGVVLKEFKDGHPSGHPQDSLVPQTLWSQGAY